MKMVAMFDFKSCRASFGTTVQTGDNRYYTLQGIARPYQCEPNELLVIQSITHEGDKWGMLKNVSLVINGFVGQGVLAAVQPGECMGVQLQIKRADEFRLTPAPIDYPIQVNIEAIQYQVTNIELQT